MLLFRLFFFALAMCSCGNSDLRQGMRIGVDTNWYPIDFGPQVSYVNGFTEDLLLEMSRYSGMHFELIRANWDTLLEGLKEKKYDAIFTSMPPYEYNVAKYDFSKNFLDLGPVMVIPAAAPQRDFSKMKGEMVGIIANDRAALIVEKYPEMIIRNYNTIPNLLNAVVAGEVQAALLAQIPAVNFVGDLYAGKLKIASDPMTDAGLHLVGPKGKINIFNKTLETLRKKKILSTLLKKWDLAL